MTSPPTRFLSRLFWAALCLAALGCLNPVRALREDPPPRVEDGNPVSWGGWTFRWKVRPREGLVLGDVAYQGRQVLKHAALVEIFVPYHPGQPRPEDSIDGMGTCLAELFPGKDCIPGTVCQMFDAAGRQEGRRLVAMHEESTGLVYLGKAGRAYGKKLVLWCASRLGGYTYFIRWEFRDDGCLAPRVGLTGELEHTGRGPSTAQGSSVGRDAGGDSVWAPTHVHNMYYRLDFDIDGPENDAVEELEHQQDQPGRSLASRDAWVPLRGEAARSLSAGSFRSWRVVDQNSRNALGHRRSYELVPGGNGVFRGAQEEVFAQADLWATRYRQREFPFTGPDARPLKQVLPGYVNSESLEGTDVVLWYALHMHHVPRTEDYAAMPVEWAGFHLVPRDFLDSSPLAPR